MALARFPSPASEDSIQATGIIWHFATWLLGKDVSSHRYIVFTDFYVVKLHDLVWLICIKSM